MFLDTSKGAFITCQQKFHTLIEGNMNLQDEKFFAIKIYKRLVQDNA